MMRFIFYVFMFFSCNLIQAQHQDKVDFIRGEVSIEPIANKKQVKGWVTYWFKVKQDVDSVFLDAKNMNFKQSYLDDKKINLLNSGKTITISKKFKKNDEHKLELFYTVSPKQTVYFLGWDDKIEGNEQIWTQGQGKYTSHWLPSFDDMEEKVEFSLLIKTDKKSIAIANGNSVIAPYVENDSITWHFSMRKPMSSYLLAFAIGDYEKQKLTSESGTPIENYYYPQDSLKVEPTYRYTKEIFDFMQSEIGVPYPWQNYKQIPVRDFLYAGMENTTATIFSDQYMIDSTAFIDKNYVNVNAHELAHQWFGNMVTEKDGNHHWLHEGFATYYAYLAEQHVFSNDHFCWKLYTSLMTLQEQVAREKGQSLLDPKASSLIFYEKGALALFMLREQVGDTPFRKGIHNYLKKHQFKNVTIADFILEMELASGQNLTDFTRDWLESKEIPFEQAKSRLAKKSFSLEPLFDLESKLKSDSNTNINFEKYWKINSIHLKKYILKNYLEVVPETIIKQAFAMDTVPIRQVLAKKMDSIPPNLKADFESLLLDKSYVTVENALFKLWSTYPKEKGKYLEQTKTIIGLPNKNVRLLWLTLAILTNDYDARNTKVYFQELSGYTSPRFGWEIRMGAFQYLHQTLGLNSESLKNLINASVHHSWQFKKFARNLVDELMKDPDYKARFLELAKELNAEESRYINTKLKE